MSALQFVAALVVLPLSAGLFVTITDEIVEALRKRRAFTRHANQAMELTR